MRKYFFMFMMFMFFIFLLPVVFTKQYSPTEDKLAKEEPPQEPSPTQNEAEQTYNYNKYGTIKLLHKKTGEIEEIPIDTYLLGVVSAEMPANFEQEALNAQAIVARTYTVYSISHNMGKHEGADICDDSTCCQAWISKDNRLQKWEENQRDEYWNKIENAVNTTKGKIITYNGEPIDAFFHANSGGTTEIPVNVWGGTNFPYLQTVQTAGEDAYSQYNSEVVLTKSELEEKIKLKYQNFEINYQEPEAIKILELNDSKRVKTIKIGNINMSGVEARTLIGLKSANFSVNIDGDNVKFIVIGYGHGVGMSQTGADSLAKQGNNYEQIIKHFYKEVEITNL